MASARPILALESKRTLTLIFAQFRCRKRLFHTPNTSGITFGDEMDVELPLEAVREPEYYEASAQTTYSCAED